MVRTLFTSILLITATLALITLTGCPETEISGCTNPNASNFNPNATVNDGSCQFREGCTNRDATNFDPNATRDDGSCIFRSGCTDPNATNFDPDAVLDDGSCDIVEGCTDPDAINFDPNASFDDGSCMFIDGCTDIAAVNFDRDASRDDGSCEYDSEIFYVVEAFDELVLPQQRTVQVLFQVTDTLNRGIVDLGTDNFRINENNRLIGSEARPEFSPQEIPSSILTVLLLDISSSVEGLVDDIKAASISLINSRLENQQFAIYTFDSRTTLLQDFTDNETLLIDAINSIPEFGLLNSTNIYGAIEDVTSSLADDERSIEQLRETALVLFTDGRHNSNSLTVSDAISFLEQPGQELRNIYVAALESPDLEPVPLMQITSHVPMGFLEVNNINELTGTFMTIQEEIQNIANSVYLLKYQSPISDPSNRNNSLEVAIIGNSNLSANGRIITVFNSSGFGD